VAAVYFFLSLVFLLTALAFVPIGQLCGRLMARRPHLRAYGLNLLGSLAGVLLSLLAGALWTSPVVWFGVACLAILLFAVPRPTTLLPGFAAAVTGVVILAWPVQPSWQRIYSPYQLLELGYSDAGLMVNPRGGPLLPARARSVVPARGRRLGAPTRAGLLRPAVSRATGPADVAVVGAGAGNDVAAALRGGAATSTPSRSIRPSSGPDAPIIRNDPTRTRACVPSPTMPARICGPPIARTTLIVYGLLDSHTLLSHASSVRLDSLSIQ